MALIVCPNCGKSIGEYAKFCPSCGCEITKDANDASEIFCVECGAKFSKNNKFCPNCGCKTSTSLGALDSSNIEENVENSVRNENEVENENSKSMNCPNCGSNDIELISEDYGHCRHCDSKFLLPKHGAKTVINNEVHIYSSALKSIDGYELKNDISPEIFLRSCYLKLAELKTPYDVFDAVYEPIKKHSRHYSSLKADINGSYSATIGIDREEHYTVTETVKDLNGGSHTELVDKTRIVTDWYPRSGPYFDSRSTILNLDGDKLPGDEYEFNHVLSSYYKNFENIKDGFLSPNEKQIENGLESCKSSASRACASTLNADHVQSFNFTATASLTEINCYNIEEYAVKYKYEDKNFELRRFARKGTGVFGEYPNNEKDIEKEAINSTKKLGIASILSMSVSIVLFIVFMIIHEVCSRGLAFGLTIPFMLIAIVLTTSYFALTKKKKREISADNLNKKVDALKKALAKKGLKPLSKDEEERIRNNG